MESPGLRHTEWLSYIAGYLDGEGCFHSQAGKNGAEVSVSNTYPGVLFEMKSVFGGRVRRRKNKGRRGVRAQTRPHYTYRIHGDGARSLCRTLLPYLKEKKYQAQMLLQAHEFPAGTAAREAALRELKEVKRIVY